MVTIALVRRKDVLEEEYGRVLLNENDVRFEGLSCVFIDYLNRGLTGADGKKYSPSNSTAFIQSLKKHFSDQTLMAREI